MNTLSQQFNEQTNANISLWSLYVLILIIDDIERRRKRRRKSVSDLQRRFQESAVKQSRDRYTRQIEQRYAKPQYRVTSPRF